MKHREPESMERDLMNEGEFCCQTVGYAHERSNLLQDAVQMLVMLICFS